MGANDRIRFGLIGCGDRGEEDLQAALTCTNVECVALADVYTRRLDQDLSIVPRAKPYRDFRRLLDDKTIDAVVIVTPQHQHALNFVPAIRNGEGSHHPRGHGSHHSYPHAHVSQCSLRRLKAAIPADCDLQHVDWKAFQGEAPPHEWDPNRYVNWRFFWDYDGGNVFENMVHQVGFWYKLLGLKMPRGVRMNGGNYLSPDMEVPDTMDVSMDQPVFTWNSGFGNRHYNAEDDFLLGTKGTIFRGRYKAEYIPEGQHSSRLLKNSL